MYLHIRVSELTLGKNLDLGLGFVGGESRRICVIIYDMSIR